MGVGNVVKYFMAKMYNGTKFRRISERRLSTLLLMIFYDEKFLYTHIDMKVMYLSTNATSEEF